MPLSDPILIFTILISVILAAPLIAARLRVPDLGLLLLAGAVLGPHGTGLIERSSAITLLAYPIASRLGIARNEAVAVSVGSTIINTTLALLVLAVIADSAKGGDIGLWFWLRIGLGMAAITSLIWWGLPWLARWFFSNVPEKGGAQFLFVMAMLCASAYLSYYARMEPIIGAFLAGAALNRLIPEQSALMNRLKFAGNALFIPFFLISVGMLVDPEAITGNFRSWLLAGAMVFTVIASKWLATKLAGAWFGYNRE